MKKLCASLMLSAFMFVSVFGATPTTVSAHNSSCHSSSTHSTCTHSTCSHHTSGCHSKKKTCKHYKDKNHNKKCDKCGHKKSCH